VFPLGPICGWPSKARPWATHSTLVRASFTALGGLQAHGNSGIYNFRA
jgi:hypothetical protein